MGNCYCYPNLDEKRIEYEKSRKNKIILEYKINNKEQEIRLFGEKFFQNNKDKCKIVIDFSEINLIEFYKPQENDKNLKITLEILEDINDFSYMFHECISLIAIYDLIDLEVKNVTNISYLFSGCSSLKTISEISKWNTSNLTDMSYLFSECSELKNIPDISNWDTNNVVNISHLFYGCSSLTNICDISKWKLKNVTDISYLFYGCYSLKTIPDISEWNTDRVTNMKSTFSFLSSVESLPEIGNWNTKNVIDMSNMFYGCSLIKSLPEIKNWSTENVTNLSFFFCNCSSLTNLPNISEWKTHNVQDMSYMFYGCSSLSSMEDISNWETYNVTNMSYMFYNCSSLSMFPYISKWKTNNVTNMSYMFYNCSSLQFLDDISKWNTDKVKDITMIFYNCTLLNPLPNISNWKCNKDQNNQSINNDSQLNTNNYLNNGITNKEQLEVQGDIDNINLTILPKILLKFNQVDNFDENLIGEIRKEITKLLNNENFSIIKFKKGSLTVVITLQYLLINHIKKFKNAGSLSNLFSKNISNEVENCEKILKNHKFVSIGTTQPDIADKEVIDFTEEKNRKEISKEILQMGNSNTDEIEANIFEASKNIKMENLLKYIDHISLKANQQENNIKKFIKKGEKYNKLFDEEIEIAFKKSVFEYSIIHTLIIDKDDSLYQIEKINCQNRVTKILFHGTKIDAVTGILSTIFNDARVHIFGEGVYFTDILDYAWYYAGEKYRGNFERIPKIGETFTCVASEIYYDSLKKEKVYDRNKEDEPVEKNGIRCAFADYRSTLMNLNYLNEYKGFIGNEYLITDKSQIIPIYGVTFKRVEYLVIWRDYNLNTNKNNFPENVFNEMQEFHRKIKNYIRREFNSRIYFIETTEEALELIDRKKYNKIIIITNGNNDGEEFINKARQIIGSNTIAAATVYNVSNHIKWVKNLNNVLILNGMDFHIKFFECVKYKDINKYNQLRNELINYYKNEITDFNLNEPTDDLFNYPKFLNEGKFEQLQFGLNNNENYLRINNIYIDDLLY